MYLHFCSSRYTKYAHLCSRVEEIFFFWQLGLVTVSDGLFGLFLREDNSRAVIVDTVAVDNGLPFRRSVEYLGNTLALKNVESVVAVRQVLTGLYYAYPSKVDTRTAGIAYRLPVSPVQPLRFSVRVETDLASILLRDNLSFSVKEGIAGESSNAPLAVSVPLRFGYLVPLYPALDTH